MQIASNDCKPHRMPPRPSSRSGRPELLPAAAAAAAWLPVTWLLTSWLLRTGVEGVRVWEAGGPLRPDEVLVPAVALSALFVVVWLSCCLSLELLAHVPGAVGRCAAHAAAMVTPRQVRRLSVALLGLGMPAGLGSSPSAAATPAPALSAPSPAPGPGAVAHDDSEVPMLPDPGFGPHTEPRPRSVPASGWVPSAPTVREQPDVRVLTPAPRGEPAPDQPHEVVVHRGDSLWSIAARHLGPGASDGEIAQAWPAWYAANREVVGADPDLLLPGQVLRAPEVVGS